MSGQQLEVADVFRKYGTSYLTRRILSTVVLKAMRAIEQCRTAVLGSHLYKCQDCGNSTLLHNSCRNRNCPKCQGIQQAKWVEKRLEDLLPIHYFHLVFTLPKELNYVALGNPKIIYNLLFKAASQTVLQLAKQDKHLGATPGCIAVLHTWGQNLNLHPHIHMIVTGGGLTKSGKWKNSKKKFFLPVRVLSKVFRGKFLYYLKQQYQGKELKLPGKEVDKQFNDFLSGLYKKNWVVYAKKPFGNPARVIKYLGRYTHRIAISNSRLISIQDGKISFRWRDYADDNKQKKMTLEAHEFIRRFLMHVLPKQFFKIRHLGLLANRIKGKNIKICRRLIGKATQLTKMLAKELKKSVADFVRKCTVCHSENIRVSLILPYQWP